MYPRYVSPPTWAMAANSENRRAAVSVSKPVFARDRSRFAAKKKRTETAWLGAEPGARRRRSLLRRPEVADVEAEALGPSVDEGGLAVELAGHTHHVATKAAHERLEIGGVGRRPRLAPARRRPDARRRRDRRRQVLEVDALRPARQRLGRGHCLLELTHVPRPGVQAQRLKGRQLERLGPLAEQERRDGAEVLDPLAQGRDPDRLRAEPLRERIEDLGA